MSNFEIFHEGQLPLKELAVSKRVLFVHMCKMRERDWYDATAYTFQETENVWKYVNL